MDRPDTLETDASEWLPDETPAESLIPSHTTEIAAPSDSVVSFVLDPQGVAEPIRLELDGDESDLLERLEDRIEAAQQPAPLTRETLAEPVEQTEEPTEVTPDENSQESAPALSQIQGFDALDASLEALLFMSDKPLSSDKLHSLVEGLLTEDGLTHADVQESVTRLRDRYRRPEFGFELAEIAGGFQFRTKPERAELAKLLAKVQVQRLSSGAMETLAIIAYRQPVMKDDIDQIRGVDSSHFVRTLVDRKLISISGRSELPGRPMLYVTTQDFLELFSLKDLRSMPALHEIEAMIPSSESKPGGEDDPRILQMRKLVDQMNQDHSVSLIYNAKEDEKILKEFRERVNAIPTTTPFLESQKQEAQPVSSDNPTLL